MTRQLAGEPAPARIAYLYAGTSPLKLHRPASDVLVLRPETPWLHAPLDRMFAEGRFVEGERIEGPCFDALVEETNEAGLATQVRLRARENILDLDDWSLSARSASPPVRSTSPQVARKAEQAPLGGCRLRGGPDRDEAGTGTSRRGRDASLGAAVRRGSGRHGPAPHRHDARRRPCGQGWVVPRQGRVHVGQLGRSSATRTPSDTK